MRIAELLHSDVFDSAGEPMGSVDDVRLVQDGPYLEGFGAALRVDGLIIGHKALGVRLGFHRHGIKGPVLLKWFFRAAERRARLARWDDVESWDGEVVRLKVRRDEVPCLLDAG